MNKEHKMSRADSLALESFCAIQIMERVYTIHSSMQYNSNHHDTKERVPSVFSTIYAIPILTMPLASILISVKNNYKLTCSNRLSKHCHKFHSILCKSCIPSKIIKCSSPPHSHQSYKILHIAFFFFFRMMPSSEFPVLVLEFEGCCI